MNDALSECLRIRAGPAARDSLASFRLDVVELTRLIRSLEPDRLNRSALAGVSGTSTSNPSIATTRRPKMSRITCPPSRYGPGWIPLAEGTAHAASQTPNRDRDPVTFVATSS